MYLEAFFPTVCRFYLKLKKKLKKKEGEDEVLGAVLENALQVAGSSFPKNMF